MKTNCSSTVAKGDPRSKPVRRSLASCQQLAPGRAGVQSRVRPDRAQRRGIKVQGLSIAGIQEAVASAVSDGRLPETFVPDAEDAAKLKAALEQATSALPEDGGSAAATAAARALEQLQELTPGLQMPSMAVVQTWTQAMWTYFSKVDLLPDITRGALDGTGSSLLLSGSLSSVDIATLAAAAVVTMAVSSLQTPQGPGARDALDTASDSQLPTEYDVDSILRYWKTRPSALVERTLQTTALLLPILGSLAADAAAGGSEGSAARRAKQVRIAVDKLGPAYIKVAQALSTRVDLLSSEYLEEIQKLQDRVMPFGTREAFAIMQAELGRPLPAVFHSISEAPVAAASLGQVYRAQLRSELGGGWVAVKVQRPGVLERVALDLVLMRYTLTLADRFFPEQTQAADILPALDEWAARLFSEMDYRKEAENMRQFKEDMKPLKGIKVPEVYDLTTRRVLITEWVAGEKLSESNAADVRTLCTTLLNAYLFQLLDTGLLHADPHPGNLIRTEDGRIAILDYGLVTEVEPGIRLALLRYIMHLSTNDWRGMGDDLVALRFITPGSAHPNDVPGFMESFGIVMETLKRGGGLNGLSPEVLAAAEDRLEQLDIQGLQDQGFMQGLGNVVSSLSRTEIAVPEPGVADERFSEEGVRRRKAKVAAVRKAVKFQLPPYFVLILRSFSVIEGIALKVDPQYSIIGECFPYLARRLLTDNDPQVRQVLHKIVYGDRRRVDVARFSELFSSLQGFSTNGLQPASAPPAAATPAPASAAAAERQSSPASTSAATGTTLVPGRAPAAQPPVLDDATREALTALFAMEGSYVQEILVDEIAATLEALSRSAALRLLQLVMMSPAVRISAALTDSLGPLRPLVLPLMTPVDVVRRLTPTMALTPDDALAIENARELWKLLQPMLVSRVGEQQLGTTFVSALAQVLQELGPAGSRTLVFGAGRTAQAVVQQVVRRTAARFVRDIASIADGPPQPTALPGDVPWRPASPRPQLPA